LLPHDDPQRTDQAKNFDLIVAPFAFTRPIAASMDFGTLRAVALVLARGYPLPPFVVGNKRGDQQNRADGDEEKKHLDNRMAQPEALCITLDQAATEPERTEACA
jgi:hypothetical protein